MIGAGGACFRSAVGVLDKRPETRVLAITKGAHPQKSHTAKAQGGLAAVYPRDPVDKPLFHMFDTWKGSDCLQAGLPVMDPEAVQFYPTGIVGPGILASETLRSVGGILRNRNLEPETWSRLQKTTPWSITPRSLSRPTPPGSPNNPLMPLV